jgi:glutaredoxin
LRGVVSPAIIALSSMLCTRHGLAAAPDGTCVLCRREASRRHPLWVYLAIGAAFTLLMVFAVVREIRKVALARAKKAAAPSGSVALPAPSASASASATPSMVSYDGSVPPPPGWHGPDWFAVEQRRLPIERKRVSITLYETVSCVDCNAARVWFNAHNQAFFEKDIEHDPEAKKKMQSLSPGAIVPLIHIDDRVVVGFDPMVVDRTIDAAAIKRIQQDPE